MKEEFDELLREYAEILSRTCIILEGNIYNNLKRLIKNKNLCVLSGNKDSCVIIMKNQDYIQKFIGIVTIRIFGIGKN